MHKTRMTGPSRLQCLKRDFIVTILLFKLNSIIQEFMQMKAFSITLILYVLLWGNLDAASCTPQVNDKKVFVEFVNGNNQIIYSKQFKVKTNKKYDGLISSAEALKALKADSSDNIKIKKSKNSLYPLGKTRKVARVDGATLAIIGGCPVSKLKFFKRADKKDKPFVHADVIELATN